MIHILPRDQVKHLEWSPDQEIVEERRPVEPMIERATFSIDDIIHEQKTFYGEKKDSAGRAIGVADAFKQARDYATSEGIVVSMPELIAAKIKVGKEHPFWKNVYDVQSEENIGIDKNGTFFTKDTPLLVVVHGGGILTPERIEQAYTEGLVDGSAKYAEEEFLAILEGKLPRGETIQIYTIEQVKKGISTVPRRYGIVMPYHDAQRTTVGYQTKEVFVENQLVIARVSGVREAEDYFEKAKNSENKVGCWHQFSGRDPQQAQGRLLFLGDDGGGLSGYYDLYYDGRFAGVAPKAHGARKCSVV